MALNTKNNNPEKTDRAQKERRTFLKKATYAVPALIVLGQLARPSTANAFGPPPSAPSSSGQKW